MKKQIYSIESLKERFRFINGSIKYLRFPDAVKMYIGNNDKDDIKIGNFNSLNQGLYKALYAKLHAIKAHLLHLEQFLDDGYVAQIKEHFNNRYKELVEKKQQIKDQVNE